MANLEHLELLRQGAQVWNQWRRESRGIRPDLRGANLKGANLSKANLSDANLRGTNLSKANLSFANLSFANLSRANLSHADLSYAYLNRAYLNRAYLIGANLNRAYLSAANLGAAKLSNANLNRAYLSNAKLSNANLIGANLSNANLIGANLNRAYLSAANLSNANLNSVQALDTSFAGAIFTGGGIQDWKINSRTNLQGVICEYIFIGYDEAHSKFTDRRPHDPNQVFVPGEFTKHYQIILDSVELFFNEGIDWTAFLAALQDLQTQYGNELSIQGIEKKTGGAFLVRLEVPFNADASAVERHAKELYAVKLQRIEAQYRTELNLKDQEIAHYKETSADILELAKLAANRPIALEARALPTGAGSTRASSNGQLHPDPFNPKLGSGSVGGCANGDSASANGNSAVGSSAVEDGAKDSGNESHTNKSNGFQLNQQILSHRGASHDEVTYLFISLRSLTNWLPLEKQAETLGYLDDIENEVKASPKKRRVKHIKAVLIALIAAATAAPSGVSHANKYTNTYTNRYVNNFVSQVQELSEKLGISLPSEHVGVAE